MQKKYNRGLLSISSNGIKQKILRIPLALIIQILILFVSVKTAAGQTIQHKRITLKTESQSIKSIFTLIEKQTGFIFGYDNILDVNKKTVLNVNNKTVYDVLLQLIGENYKAEIKQVDTRHVLIKVEPIKAVQSPNVPAGQGTGGLKGRIVELETSQPLPGASVFIVELKKGAQSDENGYYHFIGVSAGKYTLRVSTVGFATENVSVDVSEGREGIYDVRLQGDNALEEVTISAIRKNRAPVAHTSERQLVEEIKSLNVVASGISSEQISKSADRDAAQVVQRVSGVSVVDNKFVIIRGLNPRYNLTYLNDNVAPSTDVNSRNFGLDLIPSRIVDRILVYKSASPEHQADATGGVVKIYTKDATAVKHFDLQIQLGARQELPSSRIFLVIMVVSLIF